MYRRFITACALSLALSISARADDTPAPAPDAAAAPSPAPDATTTPDNTATTTPDTTPAPEAMAPARATPMIPTGPFTVEGSLDIGDPAQPGSEDYNTAKHSYLVTGGGANMWGTNDSFHFVWKKVSGDVTLAADIAFSDLAGDAHRKAVLIVRQNLDANSAYADAALHGNGLAALQYRETNGAPTREIESGLANPGRLRIEKRGNYVSMSIGSTNGDLQPAGGSFRLALKDPYYVGIGVCAHEEANPRKATFANLEINNQDAPTNMTRLLSTIQLIHVGSKDSRVIYTSTNHLEAPNLSREGHSVIFNSEGHLYRLPITGGEPTMIDTGYANKINNDHGVSPDGLDIAISDSSQTGKSLIYVVPIMGGPPRQVTVNGPSYFHGWSPDGKTLAFCGERKNDFDIFTVPSAGGPENQITTAIGIDDGPEFTPDGVYIYFNSMRSGSMQIWRLLADGTVPQRVTDDDWNDWFPHISPDSKHMVYLSYDLNVKGHPENQDVILHVKNFETGKTEVLTKLYGGQGTINVPSWSPDSQYVAFISYQWLP
jgi:hypothetical protein